MNKLLLYLIFLLPTLTVGAAAAAADDPAYIATEHILLNCGASSRLNSTVDGQSWDGDVGTKLSPDINKPGLSTPAAAAEQDLSINGMVPYLTARIIHSRFSYTFPLSSGQKILRLYFYPATYTTTKSFIKNQSFFNVTANQYTLLTNFSAFLALPSLKPRATYFVKEFIINLWQTQALNVTFMPLPNSHAFINGIEVVSIPPNLYIGNGARFVNLDGLYELDQNSTAFETLHRLNVGGDTVSEVDDTGMFRNWLRDDSFLTIGIGNPLKNDSIPLSYTSQTPNYSAPPIVYRTARGMGLIVNQTSVIMLTWNFPVDTGFFYLFRLHFCEFQPSIFFERGQRMFNIYIGNFKAEFAFDVIRYAGGTGIPVFRDYVVSVVNSARDQRKQDLSLAMDSSGLYYPEHLNALLNGVEIFKLNTKSGNLAAGSTLDLLENPDSPTPTMRTNSTKSTRVEMIIGVAGGCIILIFLLILFIVCRRRRGTKDIDRKCAIKSPWATLNTKSKSTLKASDHLCRRFLLKEIKTATTDFDPTLVIGAGGFGKVYRGYIDNNHLNAAVAIKRLDTTSRQGAHEFRTEIEMLSNLRHVHLVSLIGFCDENEEMILIYEYMSNGTLRDNLYKTENLPLTWKQRLHVTIGAARGLLYLHGGTDQNIIHRDVKSTNILLDENLVAKVSDFGLSKLGPTGGHVSTMVKGSFGYVDPEYYEKKKLTDRSDVYSFGVVLLEVLCARPAIVTSLPRAQVNLSEWARRCKRKGNIDQIVDPNLQGQITPECLRSYSDVAIDCVNDQGANRPAMSDVVWSLEFALHLQEAADEYGDQHQHQIIFAPPSPGMDGITISTGMMQSTNSTCDDGKLKSASMFSEITNPSGR